MTSLEIFLSVLLVVTVFVSVIGCEAAYRNGVSDGAYNQWLPKVDKIIKADTKYPPPCNIPCVKKRILKNVIKDNTL